MTGFDTLRLEVPTKAEKSTNGHMVYINDNLLQAVRRVEVIAKAGELRVVRLELYCNLEVINTEGLEYEEYVPITRESSEEVVPAIVQTGREK